MEIQVKLYDALKGLKPLLRETLANYSGLVACEQGVLRAYDGTLSVRITIEDSPGDFAVDGGKLHSILAPESVVTLSDDVLKVKTGRSNYKLKLLNPDEVPRVIHEQGDLPITEQHWALIIRAAEFHSTNAVYSWASCVHLRDGKLYATDNVVAITFDIDLDGSGMIPAYAISIVGNKPPDTLYVSDQSFVMERDSISIRASVPEVAPPSIFFQTMEALDEASTPVQDGLVEAVQAAVAIDGREVRIDPTGVRAYSPVGDEVETEVHTASGVEVIFDPRYLLPVMGVATRIDWANYPRPVLFAGAGLKGLIVGRRKEGGPV